MKLKRSKSTFLLFSLTFFIAFPAFAGKALRSFSTHILEAPNIRLLYRKTGQEIKFIDSRAEEQRMLEILYKVALFTPQLSDVFGESDLAEIQFLDEESFIIFSDLITSKDLFANREYFAYLWVSPQKISDIKSCRIVLVNEILYEAVRKRYELNRKAVKDAMMRAGVKYDEKIVEVKTPQKSFLSSYDETRLAEAFSLLENKIQATEEEKKNPKPKVEPETKNEPKEIYLKPVERITNDDVTKALKELESAPATKLESAKPGENAEEMIAEEEPMESV